MSVNTVSAPRHMLLSFLIHPAVKGHAAAVVCSSARTPYRDRCLWNTQPSMKLYRCSYFLQWSPGELNDSGTTLLAVGLLKSELKLKNNYLKMAPFSDLCLPPTNNCPGVLHMGTEWTDLPSHVFLSSTGPQIRHVLPFRGKTIKLIHILK